MRKRINLFARKKRFDWFSTYAAKIRRYGAFVGVILFVIFIFLIFLMIDTQRKMADVTKKKLTYLTYLMNEKDTEASIRFFKGKQTQLNNFLKDDAQFVPYYSILRDTLIGSTQSALLDTVEINKNRETKFIVQFKSYESMITFLKYVESEDFLKYFDQLSMASLNLTRDTSKLITFGTVAVKNYQLQFTGKFKAINE